MLSAIVIMNEKSQNHYDAHCPRCRRANSISRQRMELFFPNWKEAAKQQASAPAAPPPVASPPTPQVEPPASAFLKTEPLPKSARAAIEKKPEDKKPAVKKSAAKQPVAKKPAAKSPAAKKPVAKQPVAKKPAPKKAVPAKPKKK
jgi:hypothetical protein